MINDKRNVILALFGILFFILLLLFIFREKEVKLTAEEEKTKVKESLEDTISIAICKIRNQIDDTEQNLQDCPNNENFYIQEKIQDQMKINDVKSIFDKSNFENFNVEKEFMSTIICDPEYILIFYDENSNQLALANVCISHTSEISITLYFDNIKTGLIVNKDHINTLMMILDSKNENVAINGEK